MNFSIGNGTQGNLLNPGDTPHENAQFLVFCAAIIRGVHRYGGILRAVVASSRNDHRLGANEAPPAIISIFLGEQLMDVFDQIAKGGATASKESGTLTIGDRNRTSPFAFTGNRFEFRAPGASMSISGPMVAINTIIAESLDFIATELQAATDAGTDLNVAIQKVLEAIISEHGSVVFNGDGYSDDWQVEAEARGLLNLRTTVDALPQLDTPEAKALFSKYGVLSERELASRYEVYLEQYALSVTVEARQTLEIAQTVILPAALRYQQELAVGAAALAQLSLPTNNTVLESVTSEIGALTAAIDVLGAALSGHGGDSTIDEARYGVETLIPAMTAVRTAADALERLVADDLWPLPTYQEMLFIL